MIQIALKYDCSHILENERQDIFVLLFLFIINLFNNKMRYKWILLVPVISVLGGCSKDNSEEPAPALEVKTAKIDARSYSDWVYFSFEKGTVVEVDKANFNKSLDWDIAFHRNDVRLNCGNSGLGSGGAVKTQSKSLSEITTAPSSGYVVDATKSIMVKFTLPVPVFEDQPANGEIQWLNVDTSNPPPVYTLYDNVYVIRTAAGKFAKIKFANYLSDKNETMVISLDYAYQPDGSTRL